MGILCKFGNKRAKRGGNGNQLGQVKVEVSERGVLVTLGPEEDFVPDGHQRQQGELDVEGPVGMVVMKVIIHCLQGEQLVPVAEVLELVQNEAVQVHGHVGHVHERDESRGWSAARTTWGSSPGTARSAAQ